jgi:hypothetical protein
VSDGPEQLAGERLRRELGEKLLDRPKADREIIAVVPVAKDRVEAGQRGGVAIGNAPRARQAAPERRAVDQLGDGFGRG